MSFKSAAPRGATRRLSIAAVAVASLCALSAAAPRLGAQTIPTPVYFSDYVDAVTGPNCPAMTREGGCTNTNSGWYVTAGADVYASDVYERPTSQTYTNKSGTIVASEYLGYLDLATAKYGFDDQYMYFQLNVWSPYLYKNDGTVDRGVFGSGTYYGVQLGDASGNGELLLRTEVTSTLPTTPGDWTRTKTQGFYDSNNSVSGPGGISVPNEEGIIPSFNGYETQVVQTDGYLSNGTNVLFSRWYKNADGTATVEMAFNYAAYNSYCASLGCGIGTTLPYLVFETTRGLKDNQNYVWNDKYNSTEAGTPYTTAGLGNIYELDNMRASSTVAVSEPASLALTLAGLSMIGIAAHRRRTRQS